LPLTSAVIPGSQHIILDAISHYALNGEPWYGSDQVLPLLWKKLDMAMELLKFEK
jgi:hypothetical protein